MRGCLLNCHFCLELSAGLVIGIINFPVAREKERKQLLVGPGTNADGAKYIVGATCEYSAMSHFRS
jgi:hypothetical protein